MPRALQDIITELNAVYEPQRKNINEQIGQLDPQLEAENRGLQAQKQDSFQQITDQANRRGLFYSGLPIQEEQRYTGSQFLPAVANLQAKYTNQRFGLKEALEKTIADQTFKAYDIQNQEKANEIAAEEARARAAAAASSFSPSFGGSGGGAGTNAPASGGIDWGSINNPYVAKDALVDINNTYFGGKASYGQLVSYLENQMGGKGSIASGHALDIALRNIFLGANLNTGQVADLKRPSLSNSANQQRNLAGAIGVGLSNPVAGAVHYLTGAR